MTPEQHRQLDRQVAEQLGLAAIGTPPPFSTDIAAAWYVVRWLREQWQGDFHLDIYTSPGWPHSNVWICSNRSAYERTHTESIIGHGDTAMLAICRAALLTRDE